MMKLLKLLLCALMLVAPVFANETDDRQTATSLKYVTTELSTRQDKLEMGANKAIEYTDSAGDVQQRTVEANLNGANDSLPTVSAVTMGLNTKQDSIAPIDDHTAVTYTGQSGGISTKGIYQTSGTYANQSDNLIDAKTFNAALKNGLDSEFVCSPNHSPDGDCWLWEIHTSTGNVLPPEYTQLEYIESTGTQYIDTGILTTADTSIEITAKARSAGTQWYMGYYEAGIGGFDIAQQSSTGTIIADCGSSNSRIVSDILGTSDFHRIGIINKVVYVDNTEVGTFTNNVITGKEILVNYVSAYTGASGPGKLQTKNAKIWRGEVLVFNGIPAKNASNVVGMYDTVSGTFFENAGTGTFSAGDPINNIIYVPQGQ